MLKHFKRVLFILTGILLSFFNPAYALTGGPSMPEYAQFEPYDATDLVGLNTGNFVYTIPLIDVPGKGGGFPLALSYHSGIQHGQEATWVGLGWSMNAGAINRGLRGYPDDYYDAAVFSSIYDAGESGWGIQIGGGYGPYGGAVSYDSYTGNVGIVGMVSIAGILSDALGTYLPIDLSFTIGGTTDGDFIFDVGTGINVPVLEHVDFGVKGSFGTSGANTSLNFGVGPMGYSWSTTSDASSISIGGAQVGLNSTSLNINDDKVFQWTNDGDITIPIYGGAWISFGFYQWMWELDVAFDEWNYGYIYQGGGPVYDSRSTETIVDDLGRKLERHRQDDWLFSSQDYYICNAQGLSGAFMPFSNNVPEYRDFEDKNYYGQFEENNIPINASNKLSYSFDDMNQFRESQIQFRFLNDKGKNAIGNNFENDGDYNFSYNNVHEDGNQRYYGSKIINPIFTDEKGAIKGFEIIDVDGKIYEFKKPLFSHLQFNYTTNARDRLGDKYSKYLSFTPYAYSWLLTAVKSPDYVDIDGIPGPSKGDFGYWAKINYQGNDTEEESYIYKWASPYDGNKYLETDRYSRSYGLKDVAYIKSIETQTHEAEFNLRDRLDSKGAEIPLSDFTSDIKDVSIHRNYIEYVEMPDGKVELYFILPRTLKTLFDSNIDVTVLSFYMQFYCKKNLTPDPGYYCSWWDYTLNANKNEGYEFVDESRIKVKWTIDLSYVLHATSSDPCILAYCSNRNNKTGNLYDCKLLENSESVLNTKILAGAIVQSITHFYNDEVYNHVKKLDNVKIYKKQNGESDKVNSNLLKEYKFNYDYSLCKESPNSDAQGGDGGNKGKLTLKSVQQFGQNGMKLPPYMFYYQDEDGNPDFRGIENYDVWGMYNPNGTENNHLTPQDLGDQVGVAWNLKKLITPMGAKLEVEYERDQYYGMHQKRLTAANLPIKAGTYWNEPNIDYDIVKPGMKAIIRYPYEATVTGEYMPHDTYYPRTLDVSGVLPYSGLYEIESVDKVNRSVTFSPVVNLTYRIEHDIKENHIDMTRWRNVSISYTNTREVMVFKDNQKFYGGDVRVKSISTYNYNDERTKIKYSYNERNSEGVTVKTSGRTFKAPTDWQDGPIKFGGNLIEMNKNYARNSYYHENFHQIDQDDFREEYYSPAPGVSYGTVTVENVDENENNVNGYTVFNFFSPDDKVQIGGTDRYLYDITLSGEHLFIRDYTSILGQIKSIAQLDKENKNVKEEQIEYKFSEELSDAAIKNTTITDEYPGLIAQRNNFFIDYDGSGSDMQYSITYMKSSPYKYSQKTIIDNVATKNTLDKIDAYTGVALNVKNEQVVSAGESASYPPKLIEMTPAYWKYSDLEDKNMLSQAYQTTEYVNSFSPQNATSSEVTIWNDNNSISGGNNNQWYKQQSWKWRGNELNKEEDLNPEFSTTNLDQWIMKNEIIKYDNVGRVLEDKNTREMHSAYIYGYYDEQLIAVAKNSTYDDIIYLNFEQSIPDHLSGSWDISNQPVNYSDSYTGQRSINVYNKSTNSFWIDIPYELLSLNTDPNKAYYTSFAFKASSELIFDVNVYKMNSSGTSKEDPISKEYSYKSGWQVFDLIYGNFSDLATGEKIRVEIGNTRDINDNFVPFYLDDIRFHPNDALLSTYSYDYITGKLKTITDENYSSNFFNYDGLGRLISIENNSRDVLSETDYSVGSGVINIHNPIGGEFFESGSNLDIKWEGEGNVDEVNIQLSIDGGATYSYNVGTMKNQNVGGINTFSYLIPDGIKSNDCYIKISETTRRIFEVSNRFSIDVESTPNTPSGLTGPDLIPFIYTPGTSVTVAVSFSGNNQHRDVVYELYEKKLNGSWNKKVDLFSPVWSFQITLNAGPDIGIYTYKVRAKINDLVSSFSNEHAIELVPIGGGGTNDDCPCYWDHNINSWRNNHSGVINEGCSECVDSDK